MRERLLKALLAKYGLQEAISSSFDLIGDIIILRKKPGFSVDISKVELVANELLVSLKYAKSVYLDEGGVEGEFRTRRLVFVAGEPKTRTTYREYGITLIVDVANAYVSPRLSYEHYRLSTLVREGETVLNMFAGVGSFSIFIAKFAKPKVVYSVDLNPVAFELMVENVRRNGVDHVVKPILGEASEVAKTLLKGQCDRVLMPLPSFSKDFYCSALAALKKLGYLHSYEFIHVEKGESKRVALQRGFEKIAEIISLCDEQARLKLTGARVVRSVGPRWIQGVYDVEVAKS